MRAFQHAGPIETERLVLPGVHREEHVVENERIKGEWQRELVYAMLDLGWRGVTVPVS